jgi:hypothetical protein
MKKEQLKTGPLTGEWFPVSDYHGNVDDVISGLYYALEFLGVKNKGIAICGAASENPRVKVVF